MYRTSENVIGYFPQLRYSSTVSYVRGCCFCRSALAVISLKLIPECLECLVVKVTHVHILNMWFNASWRPKESLCFKIFCHQEVGVGVRSDSLGHLWGSHAPWTHPAAPWKMKPVWTRRHISNLESCTIPLCVARCPGGRPKIRCLSVEKQARASE